MVSNDALQSSFEDANSKFVDLFPPSALSNLKPLPSSKFFWTLLSGFGGFFLASPPGRFAHEFRNKTKQI